MLGLVLQAVPRGEQSALPFGQATPVLRAAAQLASICLLWRRAATEASSQAWNQNGLMGPNLHVQPQHMSNLLGQLVAGCQRLCLCAHGLNAPQLAAFMERARPQNLIASMFGSCSDVSISQNLARCSALLRLSCCCGLPTSFPPNLQHLTLDVGLYDCEDVSSRLQTLTTLRSLAVLELEFHCEEPSDEQSLPQHFPSMPQLRLVIFSIDYLPGSRAPSLSALQEAAAQGITPALHIQLQDSRSGQYSASDRERLWAALAELPTLGSLHLWYDLDDYEQAPVSTREEQLLASICCKELVLQTGFSLPYTRLLLDTIHCDSVTCSHFCRSGEGATLQWSWLTAKPGVHVLELQAEASVTVCGCSGALPSFAETWALMREAPADGFVSGVPASKFVPGPRGCWVWRNSAATDAYLLSVLPGLYVTGFY